MKKKRYKLVFLFGLAAFFSMFFLSGCASDTVTRSGFALDTVVTVTLYGTKDDTLLDQPFSIINNYSSKFNAFSDDSEVSKINQNAGKKAVKVSDATFELIQSSLTYCKETGGLFDITIGPLVELWNINEPETKEPPSASQIDAAKAKVDYMKIVLDEKNKTVYLSESGMKINLGAVAKGYIADKVKDELEKEGVEHAVINLGGNVLLVGGKTNYKSFSIDVNDPLDADNSTIGTLFLKDMSAVTSGDYERYFTDSKGNRYHHILNPKTGEPADSGLHQVTVIGPDSFECDALSTSLFIMGAEKGKNYIQQKDGYSAIFVTTDNKILIPESLKDSFKYNKNNENHYSIEYY